MRTTLRAPISIDINITNRCNFHCSFCSASPNIIAREHGELTIIEIDKIFQYAEKKGVFLVRIAGGEPLVRDDFNIITNAIQPYSFSKILLTNGSLITHQIAKDLKLANFNSVAISVDGHERHIHDRSRSSHGSFDSVLKAVHILQSEGVPHTAMITVTKLNVAYLVEILSFLITHNFKSINYILLASSGKARFRKNLFPTYAEWSSALLRLTNYISDTCPNIAVSILPPHEDPVPHELYLPLKEAGRLDLLESVWKIKIDHSKAEFIGCAAGKTQMTIFENGDAFGCDLMRDTTSWKAGNIREQSIEDIWENSTVFRSLRQTKKRDLSAPCGTCKVDGCGGGCRASAYSTTGSIVGADLTCIVPAHLAI